VNKGRLCTKRQGVFAKGRRLVRRCDDLLPKSTQKRNRDFDGGQHSKDLRLKLRGKEDIAREPRLARRSQNSIVLVAVVEIKTRA